MFRGGGHTTGVRFVVQGGVSDESDETDDDAKGTDVRLRKMKRLEAWILGDTENRVVIVFKEKYVGYLSAGDNISIVVDGCH